MTPSPSPTGETDDRKREKKRPGNRSPTRRRTLTRLGIQQSSSEDSVDDVGLKPRITESSLRRSRSLRRSSSLRRSRSLGRSNSLRRSRSSRKSGKLLDQEVPSIQRRSSRRRKTINSRDDISLDPPALEAGALHYSNECPGAVSVRGDTERRLPGWKEDPLSDLMVAASAELSLRSEGVASDIGYDVETGIPAVRYHDPELPVVTTVSVHLETLQRDESQASNQIEDKKASASECPFSCIMAFVCFMALIAVGAMVLWLVFRNASPTTDLSLLVPPSMAPSIPMLSSSPSLTPVPRRDIHNRTELIDAITEYVFADINDEADKLDPIEYWNVTAVTDMTGAFLALDRRIMEVFNSDISRWDVSNVVNMQQMFGGARSFNQNLSAWDVSRVTSFKGTFHLAEKFNGDISNWNTSSALNANYMFWKAWSFNQDVSRWDVSQVTTCRNLFNVAMVFNQDISGWRLTSVKSLRQMFWQARGFNQDISAWDVSTVTDFREMFREARSFNQDMSSWNMSNAQNMVRMFESAWSFNQDISPWDVSRVADMAGMFQGARRFNHDLENWNVSMVHQMDQMFDRATSFNGKVSSWQTDSLLSVGQMFRNASAFNQDVSMWNVSSLVVTEDFFAGATAFNHSLCRWEQVLPDHLMKGLGLNVTC